MTAGGLRQLLGAFTSLEDIALCGGLDGAVHETTLSVLNGCSQLQILQLGNANRIYTDIPAAAVSRSDSRHWLVQVSEQTRSKPDTDQIQIRPVQDQDQALGRDQTQTRLDPYQTSLP